MRLNIKRKILELITTIEEGINYAESNGGEKAKAMFKECIEALMYLSNIIEGESKLSIIIEEIIKKSYAAINMAKDNNLLRDAVDSVKISINKLKNSIINEVDTQIEVVFMPYKVSMWDSLESIWREAKDDPECSCRVVPIPYYEKDAKGNISELYYEGDEFSKDINITSYKDYDFERIEPDIIYIHNPYDQYNILTMVDYRFFSSNLSKYTDMLVYAPYYISGSYKDEKEHRIFSVLPGTINATKIIAQSSVDAQAFINNGHDPEKILNLGSPKFDSILQTCEKKCEIPEDLKNIIKDKKVFLLITTIDDILSEENWVKDLDEILSNFIDDSSSCVIWRPHPLTDITLKTMRTDFVKGYNELKDKISKYDNIILDTNNQVYNSIMISDALISGNSSVMFEYAITGKPILALMRNELTDKERLYCMDYLGNYFLNDGISICDFKDMVLNGQDPKKEERIKRLKSSVTNIDGTCGRKIHENIKREVLNLNMYL
ncbi:CDP-glycerol glycerophosphotransferase family protein [Clostridium sp. LP20]|uniref:CDP-glycerol glycerophosphotransferase family protein n=1 Tax=Clostridium sp. LP20 TaxID=3418665 RepID=UPI003EE4DB5F